MNNVVHRFAQMNRSKSLLTYKLKIIIFLHTFQRKTTATHKLVFSLFFCIFFSKIFSTWFLNTEKCILQREKNWLRWFYLAVRVIESRLAERPAERPSEFKAGSHNTGPVPWGGESHCAPHRRIHDRAWNEEICMQKSVKFIQASKV